MNKKISLLISVCIFSYFVVIGCFIVLPQETVVNMIALSFSLLLTVSVVLTNRSAFVLFYSSRFFKKLTEHMVSVFLVFCILGLLNYLFYKNPTLWDISKRQNNSLTKQSKKVLAGLNSSLEINVVSLKKDFIVIKQLTELYRVENTKVTVNFIDAELRPDLVKEFGVSSLPSLVLSYAFQGKTKRKVITSLREDTITTQVSNMVRGKELTFYFSQGNGEVDLRSQENAGGSAWFELMSQNGFIIKTIRLNDLKEVPSDMDVLVLWGGKSAYFKSDLLFLDQFMAQGGTLLMALDPHFNKVDNLSSLRDWLMLKGLLVTNSLVIDQANHVNGSKGTIPYVKLYDRQHPLTKEASTDAFFPLVSGIEAIEDSAERSYWQFLAWSSNHPSAWGERNITQLKTLDLQFDEKEDRKGPLAYMAAYERDKNKILVFGNSSFVTNTYKKFTQNLVLGIAAMSWVGGEQDVLSFDMPQVKDRPLFIGDNQKGVIFYFSVLFLPLILLLLSLFLYRRRQA